MINLFTKQQEIIKVISCQAAIENAFLSIVYSGRYRVPRTDPDNLVYPHPGVLAGKYRNPGMVINVVHA